jgi:hypothetical protein
MLLSFGLIEKRSESVAFEFMLIASRLAWRGLLRSLINVNGGTTTLPQLRVVDAVGSWLAILPVRDAPSLSCGKGDFRNRYVNWKTSHRVPPRVSA